MRLHDGPVDTGDLYADRRDPDLDPDLDRPDPADVAESAAERTAADERRRTEWAQSVSRCPEGRLTILPVRGDPHGRYFAVCRHPSHPASGYGLTDGLLVSPAGTREFARARAVAHHAVSGHPYGEQLPDVTPPW